MVLAAAIAFAQTPKDVAGRYEGAIKLPGAELRDIDRARERSGRILQAVSPSRSCRWATEKSPSRFSSVPGSPTFRAKITRDTLFAIGSSTKAFTALSVALLVDDGKLAWDEPVSRVLPGFRLRDQSASERLTARDLVTHRSGLPRHDLLWYGADFTREDMVRRVAFLEPSADLRAKWQYQNLMFMTAGYFAGKLSGQSWESLVKQRIFDPLGIKTANFNVADIASELQLGARGPLTSICRSGETFARPTKSRSQ